jgi:hypothetical protein
MSNSGSVQSYDSIMWSTIMDVMGYTEEWRAYTIRTDVEKFLWLIPGKQEFLE